MKILILKGFYIPFFLQIDIIKLFSIQIPRRIGSKFTTSAPPIKPKLNSTSQNTQLTSTVTANSLLHGTYDEKESADSFQQALMEWRSAGKNNNNKTQIASTEKSKPLPTSIGKQEQFASAMMTTYEYDKPINLMFLNFKIQLLVLIFRCDC